MGNLQAVSVNTVVFTSSGTYTPPPNLVVAHFLLQGAGGGAGGARSADSDNVYISSSGGPGSYGTVSYLREPFLTAPINITIGAGGAGGDASTAPGSAGNAGGDTIIFDGAPWATVAGGGGASAATLVSTSSQVSLQNNPANAPNPSSGTFDTFFEIVTPQSSGFLSSRSGPAQTNRLAQSLIFGSWAAFPACIVHGWGSSSDPAQPAAGIHGVIGGGGTGVAVLRRSSGVNSVGGNGGNGIVVITEYLGFA